MKNIYMNYIFEIWQISKVRNVDVGVAFDMLVADINNGESKPFNTADALPGFDFATLKTKLSEVDAVTLRDWRNAVRDYINRNYTALCGAYAVVMGG